MNTEYRNGNGVKNRFDGGGDSWAADHRTHLPHTNYLADMDAFMGLAAFGRNGGDTLFLEYTPDDYQNRGKLIREFGLVAVFDRKKNLAAVGSSGSVLSTGFYLDLCRTYAASQPVAPRFFYVIGQESPYEMVEVCINTGDVVGSTVLMRDQSRGWSDAWAKLGLTDAHRQITKWLKQKRA